MKKIVVVLIAVVAIAAVVGVYFFVFRGDDDKPELRVEYSPGEHFTVNMKNSTRIFRVGIVLVVNSEDLEEFLIAENNRIRDTIIFILRELDEEDVKQEGTHDSLRRSILLALNNRLGIDNFVEVLFNDFVMA